ncbi:MAG: phosphatidylinositol-specific phospholipase C/glycerophosphodiester phosphodiesterase family protein [Anaerolineae bacterium]|nr:MAG: phosphatidylinositol-specific phospholipase C/glycerophosphodiester phosphodiesterase family protein [Anaerolineae bacterium]
MRPRKRTSLLLLTIILLLVTLPACTPGSRPPNPTDLVPLLRAHAHNDYEHDRPLFDALDRGFTSVEADVYLVDGGLLVAHDVEDVQEDLTLQSLYLDPLRKRVRQNGGRVYPDGPGFTLLVDVKSEAEPTYGALRRVVKGYEEILTTFGPDGQRDGAVTVIISGNRPRGMMAGEAVRYAACDGRLEDLDSGDPAALIPLISDKWAEHFEWQGQGAMPDEERQKLRDIVETAHAQGRRVRFWATPDRRSRAREAVWQALLAAGVDLINTDDLEGLRAFLLEHDPLLP